MKERCKNCSRNYGHEISFWNGLKKLEKMSHEGTKKKKEIYYDPKHGAVDIIEGILKDSRRMVRKLKAYSFHKPIKHKFKTRRILASQIDDQVGSREL